MRTGFTLIELMIVIAIIAIIAAIAIPNLLESRISSNEAAAAASLSAGILPAEVQFQAGDYVGKLPPAAPDAPAMDGYHVQKSPMPSATGPDGPPLST